MSKESEELRNLWDTAPQVPDDAVWGYDEEIGNWVWLPRESTSENPTPAKLEDYFCHRSSHYYYEVHPAGIYPANNVILCCPCYWNRKGIGRFTEPFVFQSSHILNTLKEMQLKCNDCKEKFGDTRPAKNCVDCLLHYEKEQPIGGYGVNHGFSPEPEPLRVDIAGLLEGVQITEESQDETGIVVKEASLSLTMGRDEVDEACALPPKERIETPSPSSEGQVEKPHYVSEEENSDFTLDPSNFYDPEARSWVSKPEKEIPRRLRPKGISTRELGPAHVWQYNCHRICSYQYTYAPLCTVTVCYPCYNARKREGRCVKAFEYVEEHYLNDFELMRAKCNDCKERFGTTRPASQCVDCVAIYEEKAPTRKSSLSYVHPCPAASEPPRIRLNYELMKFLRDNVKDLSFLKNFPNKKSP